MKLRLSVRQGVHRGAQVRLAQGVHRIGSGPDDDVLLTDEGVVPHHLTITLDDNGAQIAVGGGGAQMPGQDADIAPGDVFHLPADLLAGQGQKLHISSAEIELLADEAARARSRRRRNKALPRNAWRGSPVWAAGSTLALVAVLGVGAVTLPRHHAVATSTAAADVRPIDVHTQLAAQTQWRGLRAVHRPDGRTELRGFVHERGDLQAALHLPGLAQQEPMVRVVVKEEVMHHVRQAVQDPSVVIEMLPPASPGDPMVLELSGNTQKAGLPALVELLRKEWEGRVEIVDRTSYAPAQGKRATLRVELPIRIAAVNSGVGYVESSDGTRYFVGSTISPGKTVQSIDDTKVVFNVAGRPIEFVLP